MSEAKPNLVLHMGDYVYRQWLCPWKGDKGCEAINQNAAWGDTIITWYNEFFKPFQPLLEAAPWVMARGNHEICKRAGVGWNFLLNPDDWAPEGGGTYYLEPKDDDHKGGSGGLVPTEKMYDTFVQF